MLLLEVVSVFLVAVAMALSLAHALEFPGKMRLSKESYLATQTIYYPGFTVGGGVGEGLGLVAVLILVLLVPRSSPAFWWALAGFVALALMHAVFWVVTQPVNRRWVSDLRLTGAAQAFFSARSDSGGQDDWRRLRDRWEYSHMARALLAALSLVSLTVAVAIS